MLKKLTVSFFVSIALASSFLLFSGYASAAPRMHGLSPLHPMSPNSSIGGLSNRKSLVQPETKTRCKGVLCDALEDARLTEIKKTGDPVSLPIPYHRRDFYLHLNNFGTIYLLNHTGDIYEIKIKLYDEEEGSGKIISAERGESVELFDVNNLKTDHGVATVRVMYRCAGCFSSGRLIIGFERNEDITRVTLCGLNITSQSSPECKKTHIIFNHSEE